MTWAAGQTGNPGGKPKKVREVYELAVHHSKEALLGLIEIARDLANDPKVRVVAWKEVLDRGLGKATQTLHIGADAESNAITFELVKGETRKSKADEEAISTS